MLNVDEEQVFLMVSGIVTQDGSVTFQPFWQLSSDTEPPNPNEGTDYCIEMRDINDLILESKCFSLSFYNYEGFTESNSDHFLVFLPFDINTTNIALRHGDQILGSVNVSEHQPTVTIIEPNGGEVLEGQTVVRWSAEDEDDNDLSFNILYSQDDGISWQPVAINLTDVFSYTLDLSLIPGGAASRMKVEVSDGYYTADDPSDNSFYVENNIPLVTIAGPEDGSTVVSPINLRGYAYDPEDGELDRGNLKWSSDIDGDLGSGETVTSVSLTEGEHLITLEAQDSQSKTNSTSILITVVPGVNLYLPQVMR